MLIFSSALFRNPADLNLDEIFGFILNIPTTISLAFLNLWNGKHWLAIRKINGYVTLSSILKSRIEYFRRQPL